MPVTACTNLNLLWAQLLLEELSRLGLRHVCIAPGSRSTPLTLAAASHPELCCHTHFDERGLGFFALGLSRSLQQPVALITTSGTAAANLYPAVIEAAQQGLPLLLLSADRPPELHDCGANQTIDQQQLFGAHARYFCNLPCPDRAISPAYLLSSADRAWLHASGGPVHLNCMYREPLYPHAEAPDWSGYLAPVAAWLKDGAAYTRHVDNGHRSSGGIELPLEQLQGRRGLLVVGQQQDAAATAAVEQLASLLGWPLLCDIQSQHRGLAPPTGGYDLLLNHDHYRHQLEQAEVLLQFGGRLLSKRLQQFIDGHPWHSYWLINAGEQRLDPGHRQRLQLHTDAATLCQALERQLPQVAPWGAALADAHQLLGLLLQRHFARQPLNECSALYQLGRLLPAHSQLFIGNSMPVRLLEMFTLSLPPGLAVHTQRGASGIDGLLASAVGCAMGRPQQPLTLVIGDLSWLHDLNSMALLKQVSQPLVIVLVNNDGGAIFNLLPVPDNDAVNRDYYQMPHGLNGEQAAAMFGVEYHCPADPPTLRQAYLEGIANSGATLIELRLENGGVSRELAALTGEIRALALP